MDNFNDSLNRVFEVLAINFERLYDFNRFLNNKVDNVKISISKVNLRQYESGWMLECIVEAELISDKNISWWFELSFNNNMWKIDHYINGDQGVGIKDFDTRHADKWEDLLKEIDLAISDLIADHQFIDNYA